MRTVFHNLSRVIAQLAISVALVTSAFGQTPAEIRSIIGPSVRDVHVVGAATGVAENNLLLSVAGAGAYDTMSTINTSTPRSMMVQLTVSAGVTAGSVSFEYNNDGGSSYGVMPMIEYTNPASPVALNLGTPITANTVRFFQGRILGRYVRLRINSAIVGGTAQATTRFSLSDSIDRIPSDIELRDTDNRIESVNAPTALVANGIEPLPSNAIGSSYIVKPAPGNLYGAQITTGASAGFFMIFDGTTVPANGAVTPSACIRVPANNTTGVTYNPPMALTTGIVFVFSTGANCLTKASAGTAFFTGQVK